MFYYLFLIFNVFFVSCSFFCLMFFLLKGCAHAAQGPGAPRAPRGGGGRPARVILLVNLEPKDVCRTVPVIVEITRALILKPRGGAGDPEGPPGPPAPPGTPTRSTARMVGGFFIILIF